MVDTNILLRRAQPAHEHHAAAVRSVYKLRSSAEPLYSTLQNIAEFWNVATRPIDKNGLGFSANLVKAHVADIDRLLTVLPDSPLAYKEWKTLVNRYSVRGVQVHDARLVALMRIYGVKRILTFNVADFARYDFIEALHPAAFLLA